MRFFPSYLIIDIILGVTTIQDKFLKFFIFIFVYACVFMCVCHVWVPTEARGVELQAV